MFIAVLAIIGCAAAPKDGARRDDVGITKDVMFTCDQDVTGEATDVDKGEAKDLIATFPEAAQPITFKVR